MSSTAAVDFNSFLSKLRIEHGEGQIHEALLRLTTIDLDKWDGVSYDTSETVVLGNIESFKIEDGKYVYEFSPKFRESDFITNIEITSNKTITSKFLIGGIIYPNITEVLSVCAKYSEIIIKIVFENKPERDDTINIKFKNNVLKNSIRSSFQQQRVSTSTNIYDQGMCLPVSEVISTIMAKRF